MNSRISFAVSRYDCLHHCEIFLLLSPSRRKRSSCAVSASRAFGISPLTLAVSVRSNFGIIDREGSLALNGGLTLASFRCAIGRRRAGRVAFALAFALSNIKNGDKE
jgi:hypothetical protein